MTTNGAVKVSPVDVVVSKGGVEERKEFGRDSGVKGETRAFAEAVAKGVADARLTPQEALKDLAILQGLLESGEAGGAIKSIQE